MIITTDLRLNEPRYASLPNIMKAKKKPLVKMSLSDLGVANERRLKVVKVTGMSTLHSPSPLFHSPPIRILYFSLPFPLSPSLLPRLTFFSAEPAPRQGGGKVEDVDGLVGKLKELGAL